MTAQHVETAQDVEDDRVLRASPRDTSEIKPVTVAMMQKIAVKEMGRGYRQGQRDLATDLGFDTINALTDFVRAHRDGDASR